MKKIIFAIATLFIACNIAAAQVAEWHTFYANNDNLYASSFDGIDLAGFTDVHVTAHFGEYFTETIVETVVTTTAAVCASDNFVIRVHKYLDGVELPTEEVFAQTSGCLLPGDMMPLQVRAPEAGSGISIYIEAIVSRPDRFKGNGEPHPHANLVEDLAESVTITTTQVDVFGVLGGTIEY